MSYIGREAQLQGAYDKVDDISGLFNGTLVTFDIKVNTVNRMIGKATNLVVGIDGALQEPDVDYSISNYQITFAVAPTAGQKCGITILGDVFKAPTTGNTDLNSLTDVVVGSVSDNEVLTYSGGSWVNLPQGTTHISGNTDVDTSAAVNGDKLVFDGTEWKGEADTLNNINDVNISSPTDNQILTWNDTAGEWQAMDAQSTVSVISDLTDVDTTTTSPTLNQILTWNGTSWVPADTQSTVDSMNDLSDADTSTVPPIDGQALVWNSSTSKWTPGTVSGGGGGASKIDDLSDVDTTTNSPNAGQALIWDGVNATWIPGTVSGGGGSIDSLVDVDTTTIPPNNGQVLKWNSVDSLWKPQDDISGGGSGMVTGDIDIYATSTGNDTTGDGTTSYPYATLAKCIERANQLVCSGNINIRLEVNSNFTVTQKLTINHPNNIVIMANGKGKYTITASGMTSGDSLFKVINKLYIIDCDFYSPNQHIFFDSTDGYSEIIISYCTGDVLTLGNTSQRSSKLSIRYSTFKTYEHTVLSNFIDLDIFDVTLDGTHINDENLLTIIDCTLLQFDITIINLNSSINDLLSFKSCNIIELEFKLQSNYSNEYKLMYFDHCSINWLFADLGTFTQRAIYFDGTQVNNMIYKNNTNFVANDTIPLIDCSYSHINIEEMQRNSSNNVFPTNIDMITAQGNSVVLIDRVNNFEGGN